MMGHRERVKKADEYDLIGVKRWHGYLLRPGASHGLKKRMSRRNRHEARGELREAADWDVADLVYDQDMRADDDCRR